MVLTAAKSALFFLCGITLLKAPLAAQAEPNDSETKKIIYEKHTPPLALRKLIDAAVLMLEARAYEQFIRTFVPESDRGKFEKAYRREGSVDYTLWGQEKGSKLLNILRKLSSAEAVVDAERVCFFPPGENTPLLSFIAVRSMWLIENNSRCTERKPARRPALVTPTAPAAP